MQFLILRSENLIAVENQEVPFDCSSLPANVEMVSYQEDKGKLEYNDRPAMRMPFTDPSPYQSFINAWITAATALTPPLQLDQAKQIKKDFVEAIFHHKRRVPYSYGGHLFDAQDDAVLNFSILAKSRELLTLSTTGGPGLVASINAAFSTLTDRINTSYTSITAQINADVAIANANVTANNTSAAAINAWSAVHHNNWNYNGTYAQGGFATQTSLTYNTAVFLPTKTPGYGGFGAHAAYSGYGGTSITTVTISGAINTSVDVTYTGNILMQPLSSTIPVNIAASSVNTAMVNIASRYNDLNNNRRSKQAAIDALTTIPAVATYDATAGWAY